MHFFVDSRLGSNINICIWFKDKLLSFLIFAFPGGLSFGINKVCCWCEGGWHNYSFNKKSGDLSSRIWGGYPNGVLRSFSCWCWPVQPLLSYCHSLYLSYAFLKSFQSVLLFYWLFCRFPELRDALEKLQLNDAALRVSYWKIENNIFASDMNHNSVHLSYEV